DARRGWMDPQEERLEVEPVLARDDDLAVEDAALWERGAKGRLELGEVPIERPQVATLDVDLVPVSEDERSETVPFRLEGPDVPFGKRFRKLGQHPLDRRLEWPC